MQRVKVFQAVILMMVVAIAASCATTNQYVTKLFAPRPVEARDSQLAVRFLELDSINGDETQWVKTNITKNDTIIATANVPIPVAEEPVAKTSSPTIRIPDMQGTRNKKTREQ